MFLVQKQLFSLLHVSAKKAQAKHELNEFIPLSAGAAVVVLPLNYLHDFLYKEMIFLVLGVAMAYTENANVL